MGGCDRERAGADAVAGGTDGEDSVSALARGGVSLKREGAEVDQGEKR